MSSVVVKSVDIGAVRRATDVYAARLLAERPEVEEIVMGGNAAKLLGVPYEKRVGTSARAKPVAA